MNDDMMTEQFEADRVWSARPSIEYGPGRSTLARWEIKLFWVFAALALLIGAWESVL